MTNKQRATALELARAQGLTGHAILRWLWPGTGEDGDAPSSAGGITLPRNCFFTGLPAPRRQHANAHKCNWTPLPGCANKRHKRRQRALTQRSGARGPA